MDRPVIALPATLLTVTIAAGGCGQTTRDTEEAFVEQRIRDGIETNRKGDFTVIVVDADGRPVPGAEVKAEMTRHAFGFGTCVRRERLAGPAEGEDTRTYREWIPKLFNRATLGNGMKWYAQEHPGRRAAANEAVRWCRARGLDVHGHTMIWASTHWGPGPKDVESKIESGDPNKVRYLRRRTLEHIAQVGRRYRGQVVSWDVVNEPTTERAIQEAINPEATPGQEPILVDWFRGAREADPCATLYVNEFHILVGDYTDHKDSYEGTVRYLLDRGAPLGGIGFQGHYYKVEQRRTAAQILATLDRFGRFGLPLHISEFDTFGKGWGEDRDERERRQADYLRTVLRTFFSHPQAEAFTMWGFWDGQHWHGEAPLFRKDWAPKPALKVWRELVFDTWWTRTSGTTDEDGVFAFRGFRGDYRVTVSAGEKAADRELILDRTAVTVRVLAR